MSGDRLADLLALGVLACVAVTGLARSVALAARGVWVLPIDRQRSVAQIALDLAFVAGLAAFVWGALATGLAPAWRRGPAALWQPQVPWPAVRGLGLAVAAAGLVVYVRALGASWRFTIDRERSGALVTTGVFASSRNPIYVALMLVGLGTSLALGSPLLIALACAAPVYFHLLVRREERFLAARYGARYAAYRAKVPRWLGRSGPPPG